MAVRMWARMRDADVGAGRGPGSAADRSAARACTNAAGGGRFTGGQARGEQRADDSGQHVAGSGGGRPRLPGGVEVDRTAGFGDDGDVALEQHGRAELVGEPAGGGDAVVAGRRRRPAGRTRRHAASAPSARCGRRAGRGARRGSSARRRRRSPAGRCPARTTAPTAPASSVPRPGPTTHACTRPAGGRARRRDDLWPMRKHLLCCTSRVAHHARMWRRPRRRCTTRPRPDRSPSRPGRR